MIRIVLKMPAAAPALWTGTVLMAALSITPNARPTPAPKGSSGSANASHDPSLCSVVKSSAPRAIIKDAAVSTVRTDVRAAIQPAASGSSNTGAVIGSSRRPLEKVL